MMMSRWVGLLACVLLAVNLMSCAARVGNKVALDEAKFEIGKTHKNEVAELLGFPSAMEKNSEQEIELWGYPDEPQLQSVSYAIPIAGTTMTHTAYVDPVRNTQLAGAALICVFDKNGILTEMHWQNDERKE